MDLEDRINELERHIEMVREARKRSDKMLNSLTTVIFISSLIAVAIIFIAGC